MTSVDWGNVPSWISAIGSMAAFGIASLAARAAWKQVKFSADQQRYRDEQAEREQAVKFAAWLTVKEGSDKRPEVYLRYANMSELPIYDLAIMPVYYPDARSGMDVVEPTKEVREYFLEPLTRQIQDRYDGMFESLKIAFSGDGVDDDKHSGARRSAFRNSTRQLNPTQFRFRDAQNISWRRDSDGFLKRTRIDKEGDDMDDPFYRKIKETRSELRVGGHDFVSILMNRGTNTG
ncbi:hypothetical protein OU415_05210 [Saccharopolyspora sp. WRP15-2]|uniref:Uncharacterized protein n=1 Tax=Saccharopolyspora oryzae TaxID=2997343 RepID=A0ABT4UUF1_9PSEU|nr:hypothetical protein [Saccharopolyspora oryzae]MDA3624826.1 hypothetical protein [Saccharopolyspora oryzae]